MKKIAPIVIVVLASLYILSYGVFLFVFSENASGIIKLIMGIVAVGMVIVVLALIYTLKIRLKEIKEEEKNDLSQY